MTNDKTLQDQAAAGDVTMGFEHWTPERREAEARFARHMHQRRSGVGYSTAMDQLHNLLYTAQRFDGAVRDAAIGEARLIVSKMNAPQPWPKDALAGSVVFTTIQIEAAAKKLAERMDYPWDHMPEEGRAKMRVHAELVIRAAFSE